MSQKIDPREVLTYLNELGYTNINAQLLKDFITDLKKLIKYENRRRERANKENIFPLNSDFNKIQNPSTSAKNCEKYCCDHVHCPHNQVDTSRSKEDQGDIFNQLYGHHTVASRAREVPRREKHISVHIKRPKSKMELHEHCTHIAKRAEEEDQSEGNLLVIQNVERISDGSKLIQNIETISDGSKLYINTESTIKSVDSNYKQSVISKPNVSRKKSKGSVIRSSSSKSLKKSDPVALYHHYQDEWRKQKFPGQENHSDLRWAVREKMLSGPKVELSATAPCFRKRCHSWKG